MTGVPNEPASAAAANIFWSGCKNWRRPKTLIGIGLLLLTAIFPILGAIRGVPPGHRAGFPYVFAIAITMLSGYLILLLSVRFIAGTVHEYVLDVAGLHCPRKFIPWARIAWLGFSPTRRGGLRLTYNTRFPPIVSPVITVDEPLTRQRCAELVTRLRPWLAQHSPHTRLWVPAKVA